MLWGRGRRKMKRGRGAGGGGDQDKEGLLNPPPPPPPPSVLSNAFADGSSHLGSSSTASSASCSITGAFSVTTSSRSAAWGSRFTSSSRSRPHWREARKTSGRWIWTSLSRNRPSFLTAFRNDRGRPPSPPLIQRDETGVGSSCSEFVDYLVASLSSDNVKLVVGGISKLVAHKSKGMPRVSLSLNKLVGSSANDVMGNLSLALYRSFREKHGEVVKEQMRCLQLENMLHFEKEKTECLQKQLDSHSFKRKTSRPKSSDKAVTVSDLSNVEPQVNSQVQQPSEGSTDKGTSSMKVSQRVVPTYRRPKVRGALLQDTEDND